MIVFNFERHWSVLGVSNLSQAKLLNCNQILSHDLDHEYIAIIDSLVAENPPAYLFKQWWESNLWYNWAFLFWSEVVTFGLLNNLTNLRSLQNGKTQLWTQIVKFFQTKKPYSLNRNILGRIYLRFSPPSDISYSSPWARELTNAFRWAWSNAFQISWSI